MDSTRVCRSLIVILATSHLIVKVQQHALVEFAQAYAIITQIAFEIRAYLLGNAVLLQTTAF